MKTKQLTNLIHDVEGTLADYEMVAGWPDDNINTQKWGPTIQALKCLKREMEKIVSECRNA